jgi:hypothetical protein
MVKAITKTATAAALVVVLLVSGDAARAPKLPAKTRANVEVTR